MLLLPLAAGLLVGPVGCSNTGSDGPEEEPSVDREVEANLRNRIRAIQGNMPRAGSEGFAEPSSEELAEWRALIGLLIDGDASSVRSKVEKHFPSYALIELTDTRSDKVYFLLQEAPSVERGWGTVVVNPTPNRNLAIEVPHPVFDLDTHVQGADVFRETGARVLILAGTHRCANQSTSPCDGTTSVCGSSGPYRRSDPAHFTGSPFQGTHEVYADRFPELTALNLHGNGRSTCETVFLTSGVEDDTPSAVSDLRQALAQRGVDAGVPESSSCPLVGSTNVQGRYTNGSDAPCTEAAKSATGGFIHIEQKRDFRQSADNYQLLIEAVNETF